VYSLYSRLSSQKAIEIPSMTFIFLETYRHQNLGTRQNLRIFTEDKPTFTVPYDIHTKSPEDYFRAFAERLTRLELATSTLYRLMARNSYTHKSFLDILQLTIFPMPTAR